MKKFKQCSAIVPDRDILLMEKFLKTGMFPSQAEFMRAAINWYLEEMQFEVNLLEEYL